STSPRCPALRPTSPRMPPRPPTRTTRPPCSSSPPTPPSSRPRTSSPRPPTTASSPPTRPPSGTTSSTRSSSPDQLGSGVAGQVAAVTHAARRPALGARLGRALAPYLLILPGGGWRLLFFLLPILTLAITSLESGDFINGFNFTWQVDNYSRGFTLYSTQFLHAIEYGGTATLVALLVSYPAAYWIAFHAGPRKSAYLLASRLPFLVSFFIRTLSWGVLLSDNGPLFGPLKSAHLLPEDFRVLATPIAVTGGLAYTFFPFMLLPVYASLEKIDRGLVEAAQDLFASRFEVLRRVIFPLSVPGVFAGVLLTGIPA